MVEVNGRRLAVTVPGDLRAGRRRSPLAAGAGTAKRPGKGQPHSAATGDALIAPMQGTVVKVAVADGDVVEAGDLVVMIEAMKMEQPLNAHRAGTIAGLTATDGLIIKSGEVVCRIVDDPRTRPADDPGSWRAGSQRSELVVPHRISRTVNPLRLVGGNADDRFSGSRERPAVL